MIAKHWQTRLAIACDEHVNKLCQRFGVLGTGTAGDYKRISQRSLVAVERNAAHIEHRQNIDATDLVLERKTENVKITKWRERFQTEERIFFFPHPRFHVGPRSERPFADPVVATIHQRVEHLQTMVTHADLVRIRESHAERAAYAGVIFANHVDFVTKILPGHLHAWKDPVDDVLT